MGLCWGPSPQQGLQKPAVISTAPYTCTSASVSHSHAALSGLSGTGGWCDSYVIQERYKQMPHALITLVPLIWPAELLSSDQQQLAKQQVSHSYPATQAQAPHLW